MTSMQEVFTKYKERVGVLEQSNNPFSKGVAWVFGELFPLHEAKIPLLDQGFLRSDLTYDVPAVWDGRFFRLDDHMARLELSCKRLRLQMPLSTKEIKDVLIDMVAKSGIRDAFVELIVTRGFKSVREASEKGMTNHIYLVVMPYVWVMDPQVQLSANASAVVARTVRRIPPGSIDPTVKNLQWGDFVRGLFEARDREAMYPFLTDGDANLTEGSGFNICLIKGGVLYTPDRGVLEGVTRKTVFDVAKMHGIPYRLEVVPVSLAYEADEIFTCTTAGGIMPITSLDGRSIKDGKIGPLTTKIWDTYWALHSDPAYTTKIDYSGSKAVAKL